MGVRLAPDRRPGPPLEVAARARSATWGRRRILEPLSMNPLAANRTTARPAVPSKGVRQYLSFVEDLNWPAMQRVPDRKAPRPTEVWVPGPNGQWEGITPTLQ